MQTVKVYLHDTERERDDFISVPNFERSYKWEVPQEDNKQMLSFEIFFYPLIFWSVNNPNTNFFFFVNGGLDTLSNANIRLQSKRDAFIVAGRIDPYKFLLWSQTIFHLQQ